MPFSKEDKALTKKLYQFNKYGSRRIVTEFSKINCRRLELDTLLKRFEKLEKHEALTTGTKVADRSKACVY